MNPIDASMFDPMMHDIPETQPCSPRETILESVDEVRHVLCCEFNSLNQLQLNLLSHTSHIDRHVLFEFKQSEKNRRCHIFYETDFYTCVTIKHVFVCDFHHFLVLSFRSITIPYSRHLPVKQTW